MPGKSTLILTSPGELPEKASRSTINSSIILFALESLEVIRDAIATSIYFCISL